MTGCIVVVQKYTQIDRIFRVATLVDANNWDAQLIKHYGKRTTTRWIVAMMLLHVACC